MSRCRPPEGAAGTLPCENLRAGSVGSSGVVAETLTHCELSLRVPEQLWVQALDGGKCANVTGSAITHFQRAA